VPIIYGVLYDSGDLYKVAVFGSECSCRTVCTRIVCVSRVCVCRVGVHVAVYVYEQILQLYPDERCKKKAILETRRDDFTISDLNHFCGGRDFFWHWTSPRG
jgi:hypothetical protein